MNQTEQLALITRIRQLVSMSDGISNKDLLTLVSETNLLTMLI